MSPGSDGSARPADDGDDEERARDEPRRTAQKSGHTILAQQIEEADAELARPAAALLLSGLTAGLDLGFSAFALAIVGSLLRDVVSRGVLDLLEGLLYPIGFVFVVLGRSALFTEHTTLAVQPVLAGRASVGQLLRLWGLVLAANLAGGAIFAWFGTSLGRSLSVIEPAAVEHMASSLVKISAGGMLLSAIAAGWIMGLLSWLTSACRDTTSQILVIVLCTFFIGVAGLHHSIAGSIEVLMGIFTGAAVGWDEYLRFLGIAILGNAIGGSVFVALLKYGSVQQSQPDGAG